METHELQEIVAAILAAGASAGGVRSATATVKSYTDILESLRKAQAATTPAAPAPAPDTRTRKKGEPPTFTDR